MRQDNLEPTPMYKYGDQNRCPKVQLFNWDG